MKEGPDIARIAALLGDPARANMLTALMSGKALTATELSSEAGVTPQTASSHLTKLAEAGLIQHRKQGRHRYYALMDNDVGNLLETLMGLAAKRGHIRTRTGPRDPELRHARVCYNHLAGTLGVDLFDNLSANGYIAGDAENVILTDQGSVFLKKIGLDMDALMTTRRPLCRSCLDWSARRTHMAGALGTALLHYIYAQGWARKDTNSRIVRFTAAGERAFRQTFAGAHHQS